MRIPEGVTLLDDLEETVVATLSPPRLQTEEEEEIESETELVGEGAEPARRRGRRLRGLLRRGVALLRRPFGGGGGAVDWLIVGLGNPGREYAGTRHNVGFMVADALAERWELGRPKERFRGRIAEGPGIAGGVWRSRCAARRQARWAADPRVAVLWPQTYMNDAGRSVGPARGSFKLALERVLVVHDEIDLPFGEVRTASGRRAGRAQRAEVDQAGARRRRVHARAGRRGAARLDRSGDRLGATCWAASARTARRGRAS